MAENNQSNGLTKSKKQTLSAFELAQQRQEFWHLIKQTLRRLNQSLFDYLYQQLQRSRTTLCQLQWWLIDQMMRLTHWPSFQMSRSEWLALAMASGLLVNSLSQPLLASAQEPVGSEFQVNTNVVENAQIKPDVAMDDDGNFVIIFDDDFIGPYSVYARLYNASGTPQGSEFRVGTHIPEYTEGTVVMDGDGDFVVAWSGFTPFHVTNYDIYARRYDANGTPQGSEFRVNTYTTGSQGGASIGINADGDFVIAWGGYGVFAQRYDTNGNPSGSEFRVNNYTAGGQHSPSVAMDDDGDFVIVWVSSDLIMVKMEA